MPYTNQLLVPALSLASFAVHTANANNNYVPIVRDTSDGAGAIVLATFLGIGSVGMCIWCLCCWYCNPSRSMICDYITARRREKVRATNIANGVEVEDGGIATESSDDISINPSAT